jgi:hypothetical protein
MAQLKEFVFNIWLVIYPCNQIDFVFNKDIQQSFLTHCRRVEFFRYNLTKTVLHVNQLNSDVGFLSSEEGSSSYEFLHSPKSLDCSSSESFDEILSCFCESIFSVSESTKTLEILSAERLLLESIFCQMTRCIMRSSEAELDKRECLICSSRSNHTWQHTYILTDCNLTYNEWSVSLHIVSKMEHSRRWRKKTFRPACLIIFNWLEEVTLKITVSFFFAFIFRNL